MTTVISATIASATFQADEPDAPVIGGLWVDTDDGTIYYWNGSVWVQAALGVGIQPINAQTGTSYQLVAGDAGGLVTLNNASAITVSLPQDSAANIPIGTYVDLMQLGAGAVTVQAGAGATLRISGAVGQARAQYSRLGVQKISANTWSLFGDLAAA